MANLWQKFWGERAALAGGGERITQTCVGDAPPIFFGLAKENGLCTVQKKNAFRSKFTSHGTWDVNLGMRAPSRCVWQKLAGSHPAALYAGVRQDVYAAFGTLGADLWVVVARASAPGPADAMPAFEHPRFGRMLSAPTGAAGGPPPRKLLSHVTAVGRDDPGPLGGKFSANFPAYKNLCRGGYQPPGFRRHPRFGRMLSAPAGAAGGAAGAKCCTANPAGRGGGFGGGIARHQAIVPPVPPVLWTILKGGEPWKTHSIIS